MNLKLRLKNKATLVALAAVTVAFLFQIAGIVGITMPISQDEAIQVIGLLINLLVALGVLVDPTTAGVGDSTRALQYHEPSRATAPDAAFPAGGEYQFGGEVEHEKNDPEDPEV